MTLVELASREVFEVIFFRRGVTAANSPSTSLWAFATLRRAGSPSYIVCRKR